MTWDYAMTCAEQAAVNWGVRYNVYGYQRSGKWWYNYYPTFAPSKYHPPIPRQVQLATAQESRTLVQPLPDSLLVQRRQT